MPCSAPQILFSKGCTLTYWKAPRNPQSLFQTPPQLDFICRSWPNQDPASDFSLSGLRLDVKSITLPETLNLNGSQTLCNWVLDFLWRTKIGSQGCSKTLGYWAQGAAQGCSPPLPHICCVLCFYHTIGCVSQDEWAKLFKLADDAAVVGLIIQ